MYTDITLGEMVQNIFDIDGERILPLTYIVGQMIIRLKPHPAEYAETWKECEAFILKSGRYDVDTDPRIGI